MRPRPGPGASGMARRPGRLVAALGVALVLATPPGGSAGAEPRLAGLTRADVRLDVSAPLTPLAADLARQLEERLAGATPPLELEPASPDRIRLVVGVVPVRATRLRGFWLPFSGTYGLGAVRLAVERPALAAGWSEPQPVVVWQAERQAAGPWSRTAGEVTGLVDELITELLEQRSRAPAP